MAEHPSIIQDRFAAFKSCANDVVHIKMVRNAEELFDSASSFKPEYSHQIFGESESIFGYKDLRVELYYSAAKLTTYLGLKYSEKINPEKFDGVFPDDVVKKIADQIPPGYLSNQDEFITQLPKDANFKPFGELVHSYKVEKDGSERQFEIYKTDVTTPGFVDWHQQLETFVLWYIDAASYIDTDDDRWTFYLLFEKYSSNGNPMYAVGGFMTIYNYFAYPEKTRLRISQMLVLPPFQKLGHGAALLQTFYNDCTSKDSVLDITVEDPSEDFQRLRDFVDTKNCMKLENFQADIIKKGFSDELIKEAKEKLKINKIQARRIYEILRYHYTDTGDKTDLKNYRLEIKKRLNVPFQKNGRDFEKLRKALNADELAATMTSLNSEQRISYLEKAYDEHVDMYRRVLERVASS